MTAAERAPTLDALKPYPAYKDSGAGWIGDIPSTWQASRLRNSMLLNPRKSERALPEEVSFVPMEAVGEDGSMDVTTTRPVEEVLSGYTYFTDGDLLIAKVTPCFENGKGAVARNLTNGVGFGSTEFHVLRGTERMTAEFAYYLTLSHGFRKLGEGSMYGAGGQKRVGTAFMRDVVVPTPPDAEQLTIAAFLDHETARIDALVREQELLLDDLAVKRQATVDAAVTGNLMPSNSPRTDVEGIGSIPAHWQVVKLKRVAQVRGGVTKGRDLQGKHVIEVAYLRVANVQDGYLDLENVATIEIGADELDRYLLKYGDVLMNEGGDNDKLGRGAVWRDQIKPCVHQNHVFSVRPHGVDSDWLALINTSRYAKFYFFSNSKQSTNLASISSSNIKELPVVLPPPEERQDILTEVDTRLAQIDALVLEVRANIEDMKLLRSTLITAATTGKIDVRDWRPA